MPSSLPHRVGVVPVEYYYAELFRPGLPGTGSSLINRSAAKTNKFTPDEWKEEWFGDKSCSLIP